MEAVVKRTNAWFLDPKAIIRREGWNTRFDFGDIRKLADSIKTQKELDGVGVLTPLRVVKKSNGIYELRDGDRRFTAIELLMSEGVVFDGGIPVILEPKAITDKDSMIRMFEANTGKPFLPLEEAAAFKRMRDLGMTVKEISTSVQRSESHVIDTLSLVTADASVREALVSGKISTTVAKSIASRRKGNSEEQKKLVDKASSSDSGKKSVLKELNGEVDTLTKSEFDALEVKVLAKLNEILNGFNRDVSIDDIINEDNMTQASYLGGIIIGLRAARKITVIE